MTIDLSPAARRLVAVGLLLLLLLGIGAGFAAGAVAIRDADDTAAGLRQELALLARLSMTRDRLEARKADLVAAAGGETPALQGASPAIAGATLQQLVSGIVTEQGGRIDSMTVLPPVEESGGYSRVGLRASFGARIEALRNILHAFETGAPPLFIPGFSIRTESTKGEEDPELLVSVDVYGVMRRPEGS
ncbi:type II secretion system protein GspM [Inquilinus limosus]|uniref:type II secretion system protein GspM n=1 Tax=Inquilinus limosus TaxID=171674 RepID=UPI00041FA1F9|nr:type II secretion system protein GspM [Inquilinus limosus]